MNELVALIFILATAFAIDPISYDFIPVQPAVPNTISFFCPPFSSDSNLTSSYSSFQPAANLLNSAAITSASISAGGKPFLGSNGNIRSTYQGDTTGYTYTFTGLPSWVTSVNGSIISGTPPAEFSTSTITVTMTTSNGQSTIRNITLGPSATIHRSNVNSGSYGSTLGLMNLGSTLQLGNIYNPLNPGSPYNPYNPYNPNGMNFSGSTGNLTLYYQSGPLGLNNSYSPNNPSSPFNPNNPNSLYSPDNPNSPFSEVLNPTSRLYNPMLASTNNLPNLLNPLNPTSIYYPSSPNYNSNMGLPSSGVSPDVLYSPQYTLNGLTTSVMLTPTQITLTSPPSSSYNSGPSFVSSSNPNFSSAEQVQALLTQQAKTQNDMVNALFVYTNANNILEDLTNRVNTTNRNLKQASDFQINTSNAMRKALNDETTWGSQVNEMNKYIQGLNSQLELVKNRVSNANNQLANDQFKITQTSASLGSAQGMLSSAQGTLVISQNNLNDVQNDQANCQITIKQAQQTIIQINQNVRNNPVILINARNGLNSANNKVNDLQSQLEAAKLIQMTAQNNYNTILNYPNNSQSLIDTAQGNIVRCQSNIAGSQNNTPVLQQAVMDAQNDVESARFNLTNIRMVLSTLQTKIPQGQANINLDNQNVITVQNLINQANQNMSTLNNNKNILDGNVATLQKQQQIARDNLAMAQQTADQLKAQLSTASAAWQINKQAYEQARASKIAADNNVNNVMVYRDTTNSQSDLRSEFKETRLNTTQNRSLSNNLSLNSPSINTGYSSSYYPETQVTTVQGGQPQQAGKAQQLGGTFSNQQYSTPNNNAIVDSTRINSNNLFEPNNSGTTDKSGNRVSLSAPLNLVVGNIGVGVPNTNYNTLSYIDSRSNVGGQQILNGSSPVSSQLGSINCFRQSSQQASRPSSQQTLSQINC